MDFGTLLHTAKQNEQTGKKEIRYYSTKFSPPKKEKKENKNLSVNVQKFLARKEEEEKRKAEEANRKREELLALRSKDKKATRRVNVMLKRTKSANQSVIEDAVDKDNTAVTLVGPSQPDEDDYGYVSQEASAFYNKMMEKYSKMPEEPKFPTNIKKASSNLSSTKDRVKAALEREKEEAMMPHKRKRKHTTEETEKNEIVEKKEEKSEPEPPPKSKPKPSIPPPMNFMEILKLAEQKQHEPIVIQPKPKDDDGPPMTKKQKKEYEREKQRLEAREARKKGENTHSEDRSQNKVLKQKSTENDNKIPKALESPVNGYKTASDKITKSVLGDKIPKISSSASIDKKIPKVSFADDRSKSKSLSNDLLNVKGQNKERSIIKTDKPALKISADDKLKSHDSKDKQRLQDIKDKQRLQELKDQEELQKLREQQKRLMELEKQKLREIKERQRLQAEKSKVNKVASSGSSTSKTSSDLVKSNDKVSKEKLTGISTKPKEFPPKDVQRKRFPPDDVRPKLPTKDIKPKQFPPNDIKPKQFPPADVKQKPPPVKKRRILDDDDEYDSEMDDFIDDGPEEDEDYSKYIRDIFGYDKSKYKNIDDEDIEEASFHQQMKEEFISTKIGYLEDLEDMRKEEEEKKRKALLKKKLKG